MKTIGLIGGVSWVSTIDYYRLINQGINAKLGGLNYSECIIYSFNYADIVKNNEAKDWDATYTMVAAACKHLVNAGATAIVLCANTMHVIADRIQQDLDIPVIHIATATANEISQKKLHKIGLLGTRFTMELDFFTSKLQDKNIETILPGKEDRDFIHHSISEELGKGIFLSETKEKYLSIINKLVEEGAEGIILGCTEIPMLISQQDMDVPAFDTTAIHSAAAVLHALQEE
ncbi:MAG: aspartate/glutamate racemase family protein [Chitinophagaceae bacterium]